jgi:hypothetical protein
VARTLEIDLHFPIRKGPKDHLKQIKGAFMKILVLAGIVVAAWAAQANSDEVIRGSIDFPGYGHVASNRVCLRDGGKTLTTTIPAHTETVCVKWHWDRSDSTHPQFVCDSSEEIQKAAQYLETPVTTQKMGCIKGHWDRSDSTHPKFICDQMGEKTVSQDLTYVMVHYDSSDYRHERPTWERHVIGACE